MAIVYHDDLIQGSDEWMSARCGLLTASEMRHIITPSLKIASNDKEKSHLYELLAQRVTGFVEPHYISDDMMRGHEDEIYARALYSEHYAPASEAGFMTNDKFGFAVGYSPDGLVGDDGLIEVKSRRQRYQIQTIATNAVPEEYVLQLQTGLLVSERKWIDFISYSAGLPMYVLRVYPDQVIQDAIVAAATAFETRLAQAMITYKALAATFIPTERRNEQEEITL